jgi:hypothetical protein
MLPELTSPRFRVILLLLALFIARPGAAAAGTLTYPLLGNIDVAEGTIEFWITPMVDLYPTESRAYVSVFSLFSIEDAENFTAGAGWYRSGKQLGLKVSISSKVNRGNLLPVIPGSFTPMDWQPGEAHHIAFIWRGQTMQTFVDGKLHGVRGQAEPFSGLIGGAWLRIGDPWTDKRSRFILQAIRISSIARPFGAMAPGEPKADAATLLLDIFDPRTPPVEERTRARVISGLSHERGGTLRGKWRLVEGPVPGLALYPAAPHNPEPEQKEE